MELRNDRELQHTREQLMRVERLYNNAATETNGDEEFREIEMESLKRFINQLKEEIARYEARRTVRR
ncbi:MAG: hypothetical protein IPK83_06365 [Planctomycetes bacterium]|nr:hypothetical protein [Planctomycetota bacterium]